MATTAENLPAENHENDSDSEDEHDSEAVPFLSSNRCEPPRRRPTQLERVLSTYVTYVPRATHTVATKLLSIKLLWPFVPLGLVVGALRWKTVPTSAFNFLAIIPLSAAVSDASDKLSDQFGDLAGALINATFGNAVELIVSHFLSRANQLFTTVHRSEFSQSIMEIQLLPSRSC
jgi:Ca2+:H+ antiporter